jgi:hypothetical protein
LNGFLPRFGPRSAIAALGPRFARTVVSSAATAVAVLWTVVAGAQQPPPAKAPIDDSIDIDFANPEIPETLPFDSRFNLRGGVTSGTALQAYMRLARDSTLQQDESKRRRRAQQRGQPQAGSDCPYVEPDATAPHQPVACRSPMDPFTRDAGWCALDVRLGLPGTPALQTTSFAASVVPLEPKRSYEFCFQIDRPVLSDRMTQIARDVLAAMDAQFWMLNQDNFDADEVRSVACDLLQRTTLSSKEPGERITIKRGSALAACSDDGAWLRFAGILDDILEQQDEIENAFDENVSGWFVLLEKPLRDIGLNSGSRIYGQAVLSLPANSVAAVVAAPFKDGIELLLTRATPPRTPDDGAPTLEDDVAVLVTGRALAPPARPVFSPRLRQSGDADAIVANYRALSRRLDSLADFIGSDAPARIATDVRVAAPLLAVSDLRAAALAATGLSGSAQRMSLALQTRATLVASLQADFVAALTSSVYLGGETYAQSDTEKSLHVSADAGFAAASEVDEILPYAGANIYFRPINKDVPLGELSRTGILTWQHRWSLTLGMTVSSIEKTKVRTDLFSNKALVVGFGRRMTDVVRLSFGVVVFKEKDANPVIQADSVAATPYIGVSWDLNLARNFPGLSGIFGAK